MADNKVNSGLLEFSEDQKVFVALDAETSEVKKAVTIDGDGVETDIAGGGGGDVTVEALSVTENGTYSEEGKAYSPVTVDVESDFSTVEMSITNGSAQSVDILGSFAMDGEDGDPDLTYPEHTVPANSTSTVKLILYKGICCLIFGSIKPTRSTGDIEITGNEALVSGNCTITFLGQA